jgi:hypothetical protein
MNDFTKEELQIIRLDMTTYINRTPMLNESPSHKALRDKVERMIDNFCEHEWVVETKEFNLKNAICKKCGKYYR